MQKISNCTLVSCISINMVCWRPLPPAHLQEFWGREEATARDGEPRMPAGTDRPLRGDQNRKINIFFVTHSAQVWAFATCCAVCYLFACCACIDMDLPPKSFPPYRCQTTEISRRITLLWGTGKRLGARSRSELPRGLEKWLSFTLMGTWDSTVTTGSPSLGCK